jgi:glycosidase
MRVLFLGLGAALALAVVATHTTACVQIPDQGKQPALATHVVDWRDEVIYQVLIDRFADGNVNNNFGVRPGALARHQGGDWRGLEDHLGYLQEMGVTTLWISPIVKNVETDADVDSYHGYWAQDLTQLNPHFGDLASLRSLVASAHDRNMKVVLDIVTNHMGQAFYYDMNLNGHPDIYIGGTGTTSPLTRVSEYDPDWDARGVQAQTSLGLDGRAPMIFIDDPAINRVPPGCIDTLSPDGRCILGSARGYHGFGRILNYDDDKQRMLGDFPGGLKDVATELDEVRQVMIDSYARWVELLDLDGFRIDTVKHVEHEFWQVFSKAVRQRLAAQGKANFLMFGEAFDGNDELLGSFTRPGELDSVFYFSQHFQVFRDVFQNAHDVKTQKGTSQIRTLWESRAKSYGSAPQDNGIGVAPTKALVNFLDNHDVSRFLFEAQGDVPALRNALTLLLTEDGIPCVYYGTEQDFAGGNDPANREVLWTTGFATTGDTFRHVSKLAGLRRDYAALRRGDTKVVYATDHVGDEPDAGVFAFERAAGDAGASYALVVMNTNARHKSTTSDASGMKVNAAVGSSLVDVLDPARTAYAVGSDQTLRLTLGPQSAMVLVPGGQVVH